MDRFFHSVTLDKDACVGCTNCVKRCPTEAIRVRGGKAKIIKERCIDCGECIRICPHHAKKAISDPLSSIEQFKYKIALPAPALYGQFKNLDETDVLLSGLLKLGFNKVFEVSKAAELVSACTRRLMQQGLMKRPVISSACPAVLRLIRVRFPGLLQNVLPLHPPVEVAARLAKKQAADYTGLPPDQIGAVFISPCPAKVTAVKMPLGTAKSAIDRVVAISEVYPLLVTQMNGLEAEVTQELTDSGRMGMGWGASGGEAAASLNERYLAADGIENVIRVLEALEDEQFSDLDFVELNACSAGCVGGVLAVENPYVARAKLKSISRYRPVSCNRLGNIIPREIKWETPVPYEPVLALDEDLNKSMAMMNQMREIENRLYGVDCGSCGAPSCRALAEDIVRGFATEDACIYIIKDHLQSMADEMQKITHILPRIVKTEEDV